MNQEKIGAFIARRRKEKKLTQAKLASYLGVTDRAVSKWERGKGLPHPHTLDIQSHTSVLEFPGQWRSHPSVAI